MMTFLPYPNFTESFKVLDYKRLGKQRVEAYQILNSLTNNSKGWKKHPAVLMWKGYEDALRLYLKTMIKEWVKRGYNNNMEIPDIQNISDIQFPPWYYWRHLHLSHKCSLLRKNKEYYSDKFNLTDKEKPYMNYGYVWPTLVNVEYDELPEPSLVCVQLSEWTREELLAFIQDKSRNPRTGRKIDANSKTGLYHKLTKACNDTGL